MRRSRPISIRWSRCRISKPSPGSHGLQVIYRKQYESPRYPEMRRRKPLFAALIDAAAKVMNFFAAGQNRRAPRRLSRDFAKALNMNAMWSEARVKVSHRLAMHLHVDTYFGCAMPRRWSASPSTTCRKVRRPPAPTCWKRTARAGRFTYREAWSVSERRNGRPVTPATSCRCIAAATRSAAIPSRTSAPATSTRHRSPKKSRAIANYFRAARSGH